MEKELFEEIKKFVCGTILGIEASIYAHFQINHPNSNHLLLKNNYEPLINMLINTYEKGYTNECNSIIARDDMVIVETFDTFSKLCNHSKKCLLSMLSELTVNVHFHLDRSKFKINGLDSYLNFIEYYILTILSHLKMDKLLENTCACSDDNELKLIPPGEKFVTITTSTNENGAIIVNEFDFGNGKKN